MKAILAAYGIGAMSIAVAIGMSYGTAMGLIAVGVFSLALALVLSLREI